MPAEVNEEQAPGIDRARRYRGIRSVSRALHIVAAVLLLLVVGATLYQLITLRSAIVDDTAQQMARLDMVFAEQTGRAVEMVDFLGRNAIETLQAQRDPPDAAFFNALLARRIEGVRQMTDLAISDASGHVIYSARGSTDTLPVEGLAALAFHIANPKAEVRFSKPFRGTDGKWTVLLSRGIIGPDGVVTGIVAGYLNPAYFEDFYRAVELPENGSIILHLRNGTVLARFPHVDAAIGTSFADTPPFKDILSHDIAGTVLMESPIDGSIRVTAIRALRAFPLAVMVSVEQGKLLTDWRRQAWGLATVATFAAIAIVGLLLLLARRSRQVEHEHQQTLDQMAERERAEAALHQAQRFEAVGQLTGGVAHDFNNLLTVMIGNIDLVQSAGSLEPRTNERLTAARAAAVRGATLTGHLLAFARRQPLLPCAVDLNAVVTGMQDLLQSALGRTVRMNLRLTDGLWSAQVDPTQIELVILNLAINARDAMPTGGTVTIQTENRHRGWSSSIGESAEGDFVVVTVRDVGTGMTPEVLAKAFEPFFTTKGPGAGSGLGLSQVFGTARQSGGDVQIESTPGKGTSVSVLLPRAATPPQPAPSQPAGTIEARSSRATILLVDDDDAVRATTADVLYGLGYKVLQASGGREAIDVLHADNMIDVLLTDVVMPGMSGTALARHVRATWPKLPVVFISGYAEPEDIAGEHLGRLVRKPFNVLDLRKQIEDAIDEAHASLV
jgi:signal transduction histidine kinase